MLIPGKLYFIVSIVMGKNKRECFVTLEPFNDDDKNDPKLYFPLSNVYLLSHSQARNRDNIGNWSYQARLERFACAPECIMSRAV